MTDIEKGKAYIQDLLVKLAKERGIALSLGQLRWRTSMSENPPEGYELEVEIDRGHKATQHFLRKELKASISRDILQYKVEDMIGNIVTRLG